jgi:hypothetical protein
MVLNYGLNDKYSLYRDRAIAPAVSRWLRTSAARVRMQVWSSGICNGQSGAGSGFLRVLWFPLPIFISPNSPSSRSPGPSTLGQKWPTCRVDPFWTPLPPLCELKKEYNFTCINDSMNDHYPLLIVSYVSAEIVILILGICRLCGDTAYGDRNILRKVINSFHTYTSDCTRLTDCQRG